MYLNNILKNCGAGIRLIQVYLCADPTFHYTIKQNLNVFVVRDQLFCSNDHSGKLVRVHYQNFCGGGRKRKERKRERSNMNL